MTGNLNNWKNIEYNDDNHDGHYDADDEKAGQGHGIFFILVNPAVITLLQQYLQH